MKYTAFIVAVCCCLVAASVPAQEGAHKPGLHRHPEYAAVRNPVPMTERSIKEGASYFEEYCSACHGNGGTDMAGPSLAASQLKHGDTDGEIFRIISDGVQGTAMPGFGDIFSEEKRWSVVNYIRDLRDRLRPLTLEDIEKMALRNAPSLLQADEEIGYAEGKRIQSGLYPNPVVGYQAENVLVRAPGRSKHLLFWEQEFVRAGKLEQGLKISELEKDRAELERRIRMQMVLNDVRAAYYEAIGAERLLEVRRELAKISREAVDIAGQLFNVGQADRPDLLAAEIEAEKAELDLSDTENYRERIRTQLSALAGDPSLERVRLAGNIEEIPTGLDRETEFNKVMNESPQVKTARNRIELASAALKREMSERIPNFTVRIGFGYNFEEAGGNRHAGAEGSLGLAVPLPLFDRNQGNIAAAEAELRRAELEVRRLELVLRSAYADLFSGYSKALRTTSRYRDEILPRAKKAHDLYLERFREMAASYPQVLIAGRSYFQAQADFVKALIELRLNEVAIRGLLLR